MHTVISGWEQFKWSHSSSYILVSLVLQPREIISTESVALKRREKMGSIARESYLVINGVQSDDAQEGFSSVLLAIKPDSENSTAHE